MVTRAFLVTITNLAAVLWVSVNLNHYDVPPTLSRKTLSKALHFVVDVLPACRPPGVTTTCDVLFESARGGAKYFVENVGICGERSYLDVFLESPPTKAHLSSCKSAEESALISVSLYGTI